MHSIRLVLRLAVLVPTVGFAQGAPAARPTPGSSAIRTPPYRGFTPGIPYRNFVERARALADSDVLRCNTSRTTAQLMECGVAIRDSHDAARFYLSAHFIEGNADVVAFKDSAGFGDTRGPALVARTQRDLTKVFGRPRRNGRSRWEWPFGRKAVRLSWRGRGTGRWVSITLTDYDVMDRIALYATPAARAKP
ncbi:MAG TPA: hypothetical protein VH158_06870 [Gemmatimonadales bacterium]|jgi:hypothetical protein|nr:hypothetical protein [Gemmatimonadales bacterium]